MTLFKVIYKVSVIYGQYRVMKKNIAELLDLVGINTTSIVEWVTGPDL